MAFIWLLLVIASFSFVYGDPAQWDGNCHPYYGCMGDHSSTEPVVCLPFDNLSKFVDKLPIPEIIEPSCYAKAKLIRTKEHLDIPHYIVKFVESTHPFHKDLPHTTIWGYNGVYPGPTFVVEPGDLIKVTYKNRLPPKHILPVDKTLTGAAGFPESRTTTHVHGLEVPSQYDGQPNITIDPGERFRFFYPIIQDPSTLWYHDHALGITRLNVYAGLAGAFIISQGRKYNLPSGDYDIPLVLSDRSFQCNGELYYPPLVNVSGTLVTNTAEFFGRLPIVNGKVWPYLNVEPRRYLLRFLDGANSRFFNLFWENDFGPTFSYVAAESNFYPKAVDKRNIFFGPGERAIILIDFTEFAGKTLVLKNDAATPFPLGDPVVENVSDTILQFRVSQKSFECDTSVKAEDYRGPLFSQLDLEDIDEKRLMALTEATNQFDQLVLKINERTFFQENNLNPIKGNQEIWELINTTPDTHPMHFHLLPHYILNRQKFNVEEYLQNLQFDELGIPTPVDPYLEGNVIPPEQFESYFKDTSPAPPGYVTRVVFDWNTPFYGRYMTHCHILEHEDNEMMIPFNLRYPEGCIIGDVRCSLHEPTEYQICKCTYQGPKWKTYRLKSSQLCIKHKDEIYGLE